MASITKAEHLRMLLAGCLMGFGLMAYFSIGVPFFFLGMAIALYSVKRTKGRGFWLAIVGMGVTPALYLPLAFEFPDRKNTFYSDSYWRGVLVYLALAAAGVVWGLIEARRGQGQAHRKDNPN